MVFKPRASILSRISIILVILVFGFGPILIFKLQYAIGNAPIDVAVVMLLIVTYIVAYNIYLLIILPKMRYIVENGTLHIVCGRYNWMIPIKSI